MIMLRATLTLLISCLGMSIQAQQADTVVVAQGRIINASTKQPVKAKIVYESLPYGNIVGVINNSTYSFPMFDKARYSITVEAEGFTTAKFMLNPEEAVQMRVTKDIELTIGPPVTDTKKLVAGTVIVLDNLIFEIAKSKIEPQSYTQLNNLVDILNENPRMIIQLEGHTDYLGDQKKNQKLSEERVAAVKNYLVSKGIGKSRVKTKAFGGTQPLSREDTPEAHRLNRRVELRVLEN
jgi:outer membrane protein OmpA-like peptidoglycan-associated protein